MGTRQFEPGRAVEVINPNYGSAYRIGGSLVLTAAHLVMAVGSDCRVRAKQHFGEAKAKVVWKAEQADIALVELLELPKDIEPCEAVVFGSLPEGRKGEKFEFQMYCWPKWARTKREQGQFAAGGRQIEGRIYLADRSPDSLLVLEAERLPPEGLPGSGSEWEGASGAAVVCDGLVIAVQTQHQYLQRAASLEATRLCTIYNDKQWCDLLRQHGINPEPAIARLKAEIPPLNESNPAKKTILVLAFDFIAEPRQELDDEVKRIEDALEQSLCRDKFEVKGEIIASYETLGATLQKSTPWIVHFSEHGKAKAEELALKNEKDSETHLVSVSTLVKISNLFAVVGVKCVVLNSGYSELHAKLINLQISYVIAMEQVITDDIIRFSTGFYGQLGELGEDFLLEKACEFGCNLIKLIGRLENSTPLLFRQNHTIEKLKDYGLTVQEVLYESYADGNDYGVVLDEVRQQRSLLPEEAMAVNNLILKLCKQQEEQFRKYEQYLKEVVEPDGILSDDNCKVLLKYQKKLDISDKMAGRAYNNLAMYLHDKDKLEEAIALFNKSINLNKCDPVAYRHLGYILYLQGKRVEGIANLEKAKNSYDKMDMSNDVKQIEKELESFRTNNNPIAKILRWIFRG